MNDLLEKDGYCTLPHLFPGDIVETERGNLGIITVAYVVINGEEINWKGSLPDEIKQGYHPEYTVDFISECTEKVAWWNASEFKRVVKLGHAHELMETD